jgi:glycosyltransferase involved in cell wall biosynthesis
VLELGSDLASIPRANSVAAGGSSRCAVSRPLVSAIMAVYNAEAYLEAALESLLAQDYEAYEIVVCDDGSTDRSPEILAAYPGVRAVRQENRGPAAARNAAVAVARGDFVACFDADDLWPANRLTLQATYLVEHPEVGCVLGRQEWIDPPPWFTRDAVYGDLDGIPLVSAMFRLSVFNQLGGFDPSFVHGEDMDLLFRLREAGIGIEIIPEVVVFRRFHGDNLIASPPPTSPLLRSLRQKLERDELKQQGKR